MSMSVVDESCGGSISTFKSEAMTEMSVVLSDEVREISLSLKSSLLKLDTLMFFSSIQ